MKIYRCNKSDRDEGTVVSWHSSKREAEKELREYQSNFFYAAPNESVTCVEIPTDKAGLIRWLNSVFTRDNG